MGVLELLFGVPVERFLAETWPVRPRHAAGSPARLAGIVDAPALRDLPTFLRGHRGPATVRGMPAWTEHAWIEDAADRFARGEVLDLADVGLRVPGAQAWLADLVGELSLAFGDHQGTCRAHAGRAGTEVVTHFDHRDLFVVQLHGRARWRLAANDVVEAPLVTHVAGPDARAMPAGAEEVVLEPGGALFVPRGSWQATEVLDDSLALAFSFRVPPWLDLVVHAVVAILARNPAWRATVAGPPSRDLTDAMDRAIEDLTGIALPKPPYNRHES